MDHKRFVPVWLSTDEQLAALSAAYGSASIAGKLLGRFQFPPGTAHLRGRVIPWMRAPLAFTATGELDLTAEVLAFSPRAYRAFGCHVRDVRGDVQFTLSRADVTAVEPADMRSPFIRFFDLPFTRVRTTRQGLLGNLLFCVGGLWMGRIRAGSSELRTALERFAAAR
ncbi:MAG: hypothetical protein L0323_10790 [Planctomycetes bacterium]|nr:hypothetical protein [Planctomycetota bacterium]